MATAREADQAFERALLALLARIEAAAPAEDALEQASQRCAVAFAALQAAQPGPRRSECARRLLALALASAAEERVGVEQRLRIVRDLRRALQPPDLPSAVGESCDVAG